MCPAGLAAVLSAVEDFAAFFLVLVQPVTVCVLPKSFEELLHVADHQHCISFLLRLADDISLINEGKILHVFCNRVVLFRNVLTDRFFLMILENSVFTPYLYPADPGPQIPFGEGKERVMKQNNPLAFFPQPLCQIKICRAST